MEKTIQQPKKWRGTEPNLSSMNQFGTYWKLVFGFDKQLLDKLKKHLNK